MCADPAVYYGAVEMPLTKWTDKQETEIDLDSKASTTASKNISQF